jgi:predicted dehydrogenase
VAESKKVRVVQVGCGGMSGAWVGPALKMDSVEYVGLVDISRANAEKLAEKFGLSKALVYGSLAEAIEKTKPDAVFDVTIPGAHHAVTMEALSKGCHVLGEKPMSDSLENARQMVAAAKASGKIYAVIQNRRYEANIQRVKTFLEIGAIGRVHTINSDFYIGAHFGGFRDEMPFPLIVDMAIHTFDAARYMGGLDPVAVYCHSFNPSNSWYKGDASCVVIFEMVDKAGLPVVYCYRGSWCAEGLGTKWESQWRVIGEKGSLTWDGATDIKAQAINPNGKHAFVSEMIDLAVPDRHVEHTGHAGLIRDFVDGILTGTTPQTVCTDNVKSLAMVLAAVESAQTKTRTIVRW